MKRLSYSRRILTGEQYESRICLAGIGFAPHEIDVSEVVELRAIVTGDLDGDNDIDIVSSAGDNKISWFENLDGQGAFGKPKVISFLDNPGEIAVSDLDGDGDLDVVAVSRNRIDWFPNRGTGRFGPPRFLANTSLWVTELEVLDINNDGATDLVSVEDYSRIAWYENEDGSGSFGEIQAIANGYWKVDSGDFDGDGDIDLLATPRSRDEARWFENTGSFDSEWQSHLIGVPLGVAIRFADMDGDDDLDVVSTIGREVVWYEKSGGADELGQRRTIALIDEFPFFDTYDLKIFDVNGDGNQDVLIMALRFDYDGAARVALNLDGKGTSFELSAGLKIQRIFAAGDFDSDGDLDAVFSTPPVYDEEIAIAKFEQGEFLAPQIIADSQFFGSVDVADIDGDGDLDVFSTSYEQLDPHDFYFANAKMVWYENFDSNATFIDRHSIDDFLHFTSIRNPAELFDLDQDGDLDILTYRIHTGAKFIHEWYRQTDKGEFEYSGEIDFSIEDLLRLEIDRDGRLQPGNNHSFVDTSDVDHDGDLDLVVGFTRDRVDWYENLDGAFQIHTILNSRSVTSLRAHDIDNDQLTDLFIANGDHIEWLEYSPDLASFQFRRNIQISARKIDFVDVDGDGESELFTEGYRSVDGTTEFTWYENPLGGEAFVIANSFKIVGDPVGEIEFGDLDGDGDLDIAVQTRHNLLWYENRPIGDVNGDGRFSSEDLVKIFQAGEFEDGINGNSIFDEGDWNGDGEFDSADLVLAFQATEFVP